MNIPWTQIGDLGEGEHRPFIGSFDGTGYSIYGLFNQEYIYIKEHKKIIPVSFLG